MDEEKIIFGEREKEEKVASQGDQWTLRGKKKNEIVE